MMLPLLAALLFIVGLGKKLSVPNSWLFYYALSVVLLSWLFSMNPIFVLIPLFILSPCLIHYRHIKVIKMAYVGCLLLSFFVSWFV
ncbi:hypothetical protein LL266_18190 [Vibrio anguillarum]|uniref:hypothetical protein n=1 Tax=Vibrio TaxID=662 RepID=UPI000B8E48F5|nr:MULTISPECIES: hypothetical protein [Vibrio]OXX72336.1 hypothetical protein B9J84_06830 [Vibrio sp. V03_P4A6T147]MCC4238401.1 hypothetical protein [Vibrio anguillarum]MDT3847177.1 hypothetical protein [Vibrio anguillarum]NOI04383.1 hypothetical protein [Vibrio anguillarum]OXX39512.1 hypothetical protein B9J90_00695 [Vibrio sp. V09_P4A23P171]